MRAPGLRSALVGAALAALALGLAAGCGVEVPDDVADAATSTTSTVAEAPSTTETPTSDDPLEQTLIDNGYTLDEARCAAAELRDDLDEDEVAALVDADGLEDLSPDVQEELAEVLQGCLDGG